MLFCGGHPQSIYFRVDTLRWGIEKIGEEMGKKTHQNKEYNLREY